MVAVLFCPYSSLLKVVEECKSAGGICEITNVNSSIQFVVSGDSHSLSYLQSQLPKKVRRAKVKPLNVRYPFHSSLLSHASIELHQFVEDACRKSLIQMNNPVIPIVSNVDGSIVGSIESTVIIDENEGGYHRTNW